MPVSNELPVLQTSSSVMRLIALLPFCVSLVTGASLYCAYEVKVSRPLGDPFSNVPVGLVEKGTQVATVVSDAHGTARFCDAPLHAVDIVVGTQGCGVVVVKGIKPTWPATRDVFVTYDETHCRELVPADQCLVLLRVRNEDGHPLAGALLKSGQAEQDMSDIFGRIFSSIRSGEKLQGTLTHKGLEPAHISEQCISGDERDLELKVVLHRR